MDAEIALRIIATLDNMYEQKEKERKTKHALQCDRCGTLVARERIWDGDFITVDTTCLFVCPACSIPKLPDEIPVTWTAIGPGAGNCTTNIFPYTSVDSIVLAQSINSIINYLKARDKT